MVWTLKCLPLLGLLLATAATAAEEFYCCTEAQSGRRVCGDSLPEVCRGRAYRVLDRSANLLKEVGPPLTQEQKAAAAEAERQRKLAEEQAHEQNRRDQALLDTYATVEDIDLARKKAEADVALSMKLAQETLETARKRQQRLDTEMEFYRKKAPPPDLSLDLQNTAKEIATQQEVLKGKRRDLEAVRAKYAAERQRYLELNRNRRPPGNGR